MKGIRISEKRSDVDSSRFENEINEEKRIYKKLDLIHAITQVQSRDIKKEISSDFILAYFDEIKIKTSIIDIGTDAYFCQRINNMWLNANKWDWINGKWVLVPLDEDEQKQIMSNSRKIFDSFSVPLKLTANLNRNVKMNPLINQIVGLNEEEQQREEPIPKKFMAKIKELALGKDKEKNGEME